MNEDGEEHGIGRGYGEGAVSVYEGQFANGCRNGFCRGILCYGVYFQGEYKDDLRHGWGKVVYEDGRVEEGYWEYGVYKDGHVHPNYDKHSDDTSRLYASGESKIK